MRAKPTVWVKCCCKRVLILGVNSFIGYHLTERLLADGYYDIYSLDIISSAVSRFINNVSFDDNHRFHFIEGVSVLILSELNIILKMRQHFAPGCYYNTN